MYSHIFSKRVISPRFLIIFFIGVGLGTVVGIFLLRKTSYTLPASSPSIHSPFTPLFSSSQNIAASAYASRVPQPEVFFPISDFIARVHTKPFGIFIIPETSPIQPEHFRGYHTGADVDIDDAQPDDIPIFAIADGTVVLSKFASGYGGVVAIRHIINEKGILAIYGHLRLSSMPPLRAKISAGMQIGVLGKAFSQETDGERRHLHFGLYNGTRIDIRGYVKTTKELSRWVNPVDFLQKYLAIKP